MFTNLKSIKKMINKVKAPLLISCFYLLCTNVKATSTLGGDLAYKWINATSVELTYTFYRDCYGVAAPSYVNVYLNSSNCYSDTISLPLVSSGIKIDNVCASSLTSCQGGTLDGADKNIYKDTISLPQTICTDWEFTHIKCCWPASITNISNPSMHGMKLTASYNANSGLINSSPEFNSDPILNLDINSNYVLNLSAIDYDGDSLVYKLVNPIDQNSILTYNAPSNASNPFGNSVCNLDASTGQLTLQTTSAMSTILSVMVEEYRNGLLIGSTVRNNKVNVSSLNASAQPSISGIDSTGNNTISVCYGDTISFNIYTTDSDIADSLSMEIINPISGATINWTASKNPTGDFFWPTTLSDVSAYPHILRVQASDLGCPIENKVVKTFIIYVNNCDTNSVWPGDANHDFQANVFDLIPLGIAMGTQGSTRAGANISWTAQPANNWGNTLPSGIDYKHADCDGDGIVDTADAMAIIMNYGQIHLKPVGSNNGTQHQSVGRSSNVDLYIDYNNSINNGQWVNIPVSLGSSSNPVIGAYSIAFELRYDASLIEANSVTFSIDTSWMGQKGSDLYSISKDFYAIGQLDVGITRLDHNEINGDGPIGYLSFKTENLTNQAQSLAIGFDSVSLVNNQGIQIGVNKITDSLVIGNTMVNLNNIEPTSKVDIYPNPATNHINIAGLDGETILEIYNISGQLVKQESITNNIERINIENLPKGIYNITLQTLNNEVTHFKLIK